MTEIRIPNPTGDELAEYDTAELKELVGEISHARYRLSGVEHAAVQEIDRRES